MMNETIKAIVKADIERIINEAETLAKVEAEKKIEAEKKEMDLPF